MSPITCESFRALAAEVLSRAPSRGADDLDAELEWHRHLVECDACREHLAAERRLEELLACVPAPELPADLAARVRTALGPVRRRWSDERSLDRLLDAVPDAEAPAGLSARVLAGLEPERTGALVPRPRPVARRLALAAAVLVAAVLAWTLLPRGASAPRDDVALAPDEPALEEDAELVLYALENWDLLMGADVDAFLASLDPVEAALFELPSLDGEEVR